MQVKEVEEAFDRAKKAVKDKKEAYMKSVESKIEELLRKTYEVLSK
ncbi:MAG: hypothetical protein QXJ67_04505 [Nitrososphaerota archaeon]